MTLRLVRFRILYQTAGMVGLVLAAKIGLHHPDVGASQRSISDDLTRQTRARLAGSRFLRLSLNRPKAEQIADDHEAVALAKGGHQVGEGTKGLPSTQLQKDNRAGLHACQYPIDDLDRGRPPVCDRLPVNRVHVPQN